jgi:NitT/TauT family transport system substrate-binding protein
LIRPHGCCRPRESGGPYSRHRDYGSPLARGRQGKSGSHHPTFDVLKRVALTGVVAALVLWPASAALALDKVRLGKAVPNSFAFSATEVGIEAKIFEKEGIEIEVTSFRGDAQLQQALAAGSLDVGLGSGPGLGFRAKGAPAIGVAAMYGPPANLALVLPFDTPVKSVRDLKGKRVGVTTAGSLTDWLVRELSRQQGWGSDGIQILALGQMQARLAAIQRGELDGMVIEAASGYELEEAGKARNFLLFGDIAKDFYTHVIFATDDMIEKRPDLLRRFLRGWFSTIAFMRANKDFVVATAARTIEVKPGIASRIYDAQMAGFSPDGAWNPAAIDVIRHSLKELGILASVPEAKAIHNDKFVPVKF